MNSLLSFFRKFAKKPEGEPVHRQYLLENRRQELYRTVDFLKEKFPSSYTEHGFGDFDLDKFLDIYKESASNNNIYKDYIDYMIGHIATLAVENRLFPYDISTPDVMQNIETTERFLRLILNEIIRAGISPKK